MKIISNNHSNLTNLFIKFENYLLNSNFNLIIVTIESNVCI